MLQSESYKTKTKPSTKTIAFSSFQKDNYDSDSDCDLDLEVMTIFTKQFKKLFTKKPDENELKNKKQSP